MAVYNSGMYREAILRHARNPANQGRLENPHRTARASNPLCGDELEVTLNLEGATIEAVKFLARGCTIVQAAASLTSEMVTGMPLENVGPLATGLRTALAAPGGEWPAELAHLEPLAALREHRSRLRCALLPWEALLACADGTGESPGKAK